jgi:PAS domain S-box-containing protein
VRFFLGIGLILLGFCLVCAYVIYRQGRMLLESAAHAKSEIVINAVEASQNYVRDVLRPKIYEVLGRDAFVLEAMSTSFVARSVMDRFNASMPEYHFRRVAIGARNPSSEANPHEVRMIQHFARHPEEKDWRGIVQEGGESQFMRFRPVYFRQSCLHCHGAVESAPPALLELYGRERGFGRREGDLAGVIAVGISMDVALSELKGKAFSVFMSSLFGAVLLFLAISSLFNRLVAHDLRGILNIFKEGLGDVDTGQGESSAHARPADLGLGTVPGDLRWADELRHFEELRGKDEIEVISQAARGMADRLRENQARLRGNFEMLQSIFDSITDMVILLDRDFRIRMVNKAYLKRYSLGESDVLGQLCSAMHLADGCPFHSCGMRKALESREPVLEEVRTTAGEIFLMHFYPVVDETGRVVSMVRYARDITQQKRIEEQIRNAEKLASVGQLAAGIAHEINNPLGVILCHTDLLKRQLQSEPQALSDVGTIEKHTLNCKRIVSDLLKFARGESGSMQLKAVNHVIEEAAGMLAHQFSRQGISIDLDLAPDLPLLAMDEERLKQVFVNLLVNARQAMEEGGVMGIASRYLPASRQIELRFRDTGKGIPPEIQKRIFDPFFSTKDSSEGTGIGLSVSYGIVRDHRGEILVQSEPGLWTEFTVLLPVSEGA